MPKVVSLPEPCAFTLRLARGATLQLTPFHDSPYVALTLSGPAGGDAGGIMISAESARTLGAWLTRMADECGTSVRRSGERRDVVEPPATTPAPIGAAVPLPDYDESVTTFARVAVPVFADWCSIDVIEGGDLRRVAVVQADTSKAELARMLAQYPPDPNGRHPKAEILRTGGHDLCLDIDDSRIVAAARNEEHLAALRSVGVRSALNVPLVDREQIIGLMSFVSAESARRYGESDVPMALALARCTAIAVSNARLYREARQMLRAKIADSPARRPRHPRARRR